MRRVPMLAETGTLVVRAGHPLTSEKVTRERLFAFLSEALQAVADLTDSNG
jgi:hypothetical protein